MSSNLEELFSYYVRVAGLPAPDREVMLVDGRRWRVDFAWPVHQVAVEIDGGTWTGGRHVRGKGFENDCRKKNEIQKRGWTIYCFTGEMVKSGEAIIFLKDIFQDI